QQLDFLHGVQAALRVDVEAAYGFDLVIEEIDAVGQHRTHGKEIDQSTANAEFAGGRDLRDVTVVRQHELLTQRRFVERVALPKRERVRREKFGGRQSVQRGGDRRHQNIDSVLHERMQRAQALRDQILV